MCGTHAQSNRDDKSDKKQKQKKKIGSASRLACEKPARPPSAADVSLCTSKTKKHNYIFEFTLFVNTCYHSICYILYNIKCVYGLEAYYPRYLMPIKTNIYIIYTTLAMSTRSRWYYTRISILSRQISIQYIYYLIINFFFFFSFKNVIYNGPSAGAWRDRQAANAFDQQQQP